MITLGAISGCLPEFEQVHGEHILYESSDELHPCAGNAAYVDGAVPFLARQLGVKARRPLRYSWLTARDVPGLFNDRDEGARHLGGLAIGQYAWGENPALIHEVAHIVMGGRSSAPFFKEGVAVAMDIIEENGTGPRYLDKISFDPRETMTAKNSDYVDFRAAGLFVTFLLVRHGPERLNDFYRSLSSPFTLERIGDVFQHVYGVSLDAEVEVFMGGQLPCEADHFDMQLVECTGPTIGWVNESLWRFAETMSCDTPGVVGGVGPDQVWPSFHAVTVDVSISGLYGLTIETAGEESLRFGPCFGCPWDFKDEGVSANQKVGLQLEAGKYYVRVNSRSDAVSDIDVSLRQLF